jgi:hypothetical protein
MPDNPRLKGQNITDWQHYFAELVPRAVSLALHKQFRPAAYGRLLQAEEGRGFVHVKAVSEIIYADFIHERKVSNFEGLISEILDSLGQ